MPPQVSSPLLLALFAEDFWCYGNSGLTQISGGLSTGQPSYSGLPACNSAPTGVPALLAPVNTSCATTATHLNGVIGNGVDFYCDGYIGFLQLRDCPDKIGVLNDFIAGASTTAPTAAPTAAPTVGPTNCDAVRDDGEHFDTNSREFCEAAFAGGHCDSPSVFASCNFTCTGCTAAPTSSPTVAAAPTSAPTSSIEGLVASVATLVSQVATLNSSLIATQADLARVRACNDAGQLYSSSTDTCTSPSPGSSGPPGPPGPPGPQTIPTDTSNSIVALETTLARIVACNAAGQLYNSDTDACADQPQSSGTTECLRPACGQGTRAQDGECIPDCEDLRRRSLDCHPFCDGPDGLTTGVTSETQTTATVGTAPQSESPSTNITSDSFQSSSSTPAWALAVGIAAAVLLMCLIVAVVMFLRERLTNKYRRNAPSAVQNPVYDAPPLGGDPCTPVTAMDDEFYVAGSPIYAAVDDAAASSTA